MLKRELAFLPLIKQKELAFFNTQIAPIDEILGLILFGSFARGDFHEYSDFDFLFVLKKKYSH